MDTAYYDANGSLIGSGSQLVAAGWTLESVVVNGVGMVLWVAPDGTRYRQTNINPEGTAVSLTPYTPPPSNGDDAGGGTPAPNFNAGPLLIAGAILLSAVIAASRR